MSKISRRRMLKNPLPISGFTLIEILIALAITALVSLFLYETFISTSRVTEKIDQEREVYEEIRLTTDQLNRELLGAYQSSVSSTPLDFSGEHLTGPDGEMDTLSFYSMSHLHLIPNQPEADLTKVHYFLEKSPDAKWYRLSHEEYPHFLSNGPPEKEILIEKVKELFFRYYDGKTWLTEWDSKKLNNSIPLAVRVNFIVINQNGDQEEWAHQVNLFGNSPH